MVIVRNFFCKLRLCLSLNITFLFFISSCLASTQTLFDENTHSGKFIKKYIQEYSDSYVEAGIKKKMINDFESALDDFFKAAHCGNISAMYHIGKIYEAQNKIELALKWYVLSFQNKWFEDTKKAQSHCSRINLEKLLPKKVNVVLLYPETFNDVDKTFRIKAIIEFYKNKSAEPYLSDMENEFTIQILERKRDNLLLDQTINNNEIYNRNRFLSGCNFYEFKLFDAAVRSFNESSIPEALHSIGYMYDEDEIQSNSFTNYEKAALYYKKAATISSFNNLGKLYKDGHIGQINEKPDYETAKLYYELSGSPDALIGLGVLYREGYIGGEPNYKKAKSIFKQSKTAHGYIAIIDLYKKMEKSGNINYKKIEVYLRLALSIKEKNALNEKNPLFDERYNLEAHGLLGYYYATNTFLIKDSALLAFEHLEQATKCTNKHVSEQAHYNLGLLYSNNLENYDKAMENYQKANIFEAYNNMGSLYEKGYYGAKEDGTPDYEKAIEYYKKSNYYLSKLSILAIYQLYLDNIDPQVIVQSIEDINNILPDLNFKDRFYLKGLAEYYLGNTENAVEDLELAYYFGNDQENLLDLIRELKDSLEKNKIEAQINDPIAEQPLKIPSALQSKTKISSYTPAKRKLIKENKNIEKARQAKQKFLETNKGFSKSKAESEISINKAYTNSEGANFFRNWINSISDERSRKIIEENLNKLKTGEGDIKPLKPHHNLFELRMKSSGHRVYFSIIAQEERKINLLLIGGNKNSQNEDIKLAAKYLVEYQIRN